METPRARVRPTPYREGQSAIRESAKDALIYLPPDYFPHNLSCNGLNGQLVMGTEINVHGSGPIEISDAHQVIQGFSIR